VRAEGSATAPRAGKQSESGYCKIALARLDCRHKPQRDVTRRFHPDRGCASLVEPNLEEGTVPVGTCPDCEAQVHVDLDADKGDLVSCDECGTQLEVVGLDPVELDIAEEDLDDEDEDDEF